MIFILWVILKILSCHLGHGHRASGNSGNTAANLLRQHFSVIPMFRRTVYDLKIVAAIALLVWVDLSVLLF